MRPLTKLEEPEILRANKDAWTASYIENGGSTSPWRHDDIKLRLTAETSGRCAYCEGAILSVSFGDIEHIKPRNKFPSFVLAWDNLTLSCSRCNGKKSNKWDDQLPFLNPYVDELEDHIFFAGSVAHYRSERGMYTIRELDLNGAARLEAREAAIRSLSLTFERMENSTSDYAKLQFQELINALISDGEYSAALRSVAVLRSQRTRDFQLR